MADPEFLLVRNVVAVNVPNLFTIRVKVDASLPVTFMSAEASFFPFKIQAWHIVN